uniref:CRISPR-associated protein csd1 n=1 Tax=Candidatus Endomicrobium sp. MdDo-005 TaxID=1837115 RepID=A0A1C9ZTD0_9BACT|nr:CRISPR-associated protein csd1 [Candidatus Endomicrobium sp. MdDo-005]
MSWFQRLYETYEDCVKASERTKVVIAPVAHTHKDVNITIRLDDKDFDVVAEDIKVTEVGEDTIVPTTDDNNCKWGLAVNIKTYLNLNEKKRYQSQLQDWVNFDPSNKEIAVVNKYIQSGRLIEDLIQKKVLRKNDGLNEEKEDKYKVFIGEKQKQDVFIRWIVGTDKNRRETWKNDGIKRSWQGFMKHKIALANGQDAEATSRPLCYRPLCYISGEYAVLTTKHPYANAKAKLISAEDKKNFVFNGRFATKGEVVGIGYEVTQKAHNTLKWLMSKKRDQAYQNGEQKFVAWTIENVKSSLPKVGDSSDSLLEEESIREISGNVGQVFGSKLAKKIRGYKEDLNPNDNDNTAIIGIDDASPGRTAVIYYREIKCSSFLDNIENWHKKYAWQQYYENRKGKYIYFFGAPSIDVIANAYFYKKTNTEKKGGRYTIGRNEYKIKKKIIRELIPSIVENKEIPKYIEEKFVRKASNPVALEDQQWKTILRIACSIYKGNKPKEEYKMCLDEENKNRDYLYGRMLAVIHKGEYSILKERKNEEDHLGKSVRQTNAQRLMKRFSENPFDTWKLLYEKFNSAYGSRIKGNWVENMIKNIVVAGNTEELKSNKPLTGEYLLGFFCQLKELESPKKLDKGDKNNECTE